MRIIPLLILLIIGMAACNSTPSAKGIQVVKIITDEGDITLELYAEKAPQSVKAFLDNVDKGTYKKSSFYRVLKSEDQPSIEPKADLIQGGIWNRQKEPQSYPKVPHETTQQTGIKHLAGTISFAREAPGTASTEFFICLVDQPGLDFGGDNNPDGQGYAAFGRVTNGMDVVNKIYQMPDTEKYFDHPVIILDIKRF